MKNILFLFLIIPLNIFSTSFDPLEEAILQVNAEKVEEILNVMQPLSDSQKVKYFTLAQFTNDRLSTENCIKKIKGGPESGLAYLGLLSFLGSSWFGIIYSLEYEHNYRNYGIRPLVIAGIVLASSFLLLAKAAVYEEQIKNEKEKKLRDSLYIRNKICLL